MDLLTLVESHLRNVAATLVAEAAPPAMAGQIVVEPSRRQGHGDFTSAIALGGDGRSGHNTRLLAGQVASRLRLHPDFSKVEVAGPGFVNLTLASSLWGRMLAGLLAEGANYGRSWRGEGRAVEIGFVPVGRAEPLPEQFTRSEVVGNALANLLDFTGFRTSRSYGVNREGDITIRLGRPVQLISDRGDASVCPSLSDLVAELGEDAARFGMLMHRSDAPVVLDAALLSDFSTRNPLFQVQYAHARCYGILEKGEGGEPSHWNNEAFGDEGARLILRQLALYPKRVEQAALAGEPSWIAEYLLELANLLHAHYNRSLSASHLRFIRVDDRLLTGARMALVHGVGTVLKSGLLLLGVDAPEEIR